MRKFLLVVIWLLGFSAAAFATDVTITAATFPNANFTGIGNDRAITVTVTNGSSLVTSSAVFPSSIVGVGGFRVLLGGNAYTVQSVASTSSLTLTSNFSGSTGSTTMTLYKYILVQVYADRAFQPLGESYIVQPSPAFYKRFAASIVNDGSTNNLYLPEVILDATTDALISNQARYSVRYYRPDGVSLIGSFSCPSQITQLALPPTTPTSWTAICQFNSPSAIIPPNNETYAKNIIDYRFPSCATERLYYFEASGNVLKCLTLGSNLSISSGTLNATLSGSISDPGSNGIVVRTSAGVTTARSLAVGSNLSISNADGVSGNPTISLGSNVVASVVNDTNITGSIAGNALSLGFSSTLAKNRQHANTLYSDAVIGLTVSPRTSGTPAVLLQVNTPADTGLANSESIFTQFGSGATRTFTGGGSAIGLQRTHNFAAETYAAASAQTITEAVTNYFANAPQSGANMTFTRSYNSIFAAGRVRFTDPIEIGAGLDLTLERAEDRVLGLGNYDGSLGGTIRAYADSPSQITTNQNNYDPGGKSLFIRLNSNASVNLTGIAMGTAVDGEIHWLHNVGSFPLVFKHQSVSSSAANRIITSSALDLHLAPGEVAFAQYDEALTSWRLSKMSSGIRAPVTLTDAATIATDVAFGLRFKVTLAGNRTLGAPTNAVDGAQVVWEFCQDGTGSRTLTLTTGAAGFILGTDISSVTLSTAANACDFMTAAYSSSANRWRVMGFVRGY